MKLSISVMAHPSRAEYFSYLNRALGDVKFSIDSESKGLIWNCANAWKMYDPTADYHVVIQDDAIVCENFKERAETIIKNETAVHGDMCFNFYYGRRVKLRAEAAKGLKKRYIISNRPRWGVAICLPTRRIPEMLKFYSTMKLKQDDERISRYLNLKGIKVYFPMPSLIDHRADAKSLVGNAFSGGRRAYKFIDEK